MTSQPFAGSGTLSTYAGRRRLKSDFISISMRRTSAALLAAFLGAFSAATAAETSLLPTLAGVRPGFCIDMGGSNAAMLASAGWIVQGLAFDAEGLKRARAAVDSANLVGAAQLSRLVHGPLPYVEGLADLVLVENSAALTAQGIDETECLRVLADGGLLLTWRNGAWKSMTRPARAPTTKWTHPAGGPDGNRYAPDAPVGPFALSWQAGTPQNLIHWATTRGYVAAQGRVFMMTMNDPSNLKAAAGPSRQQWLMARRGSNGLLLWKIPLGGTDPNSDLAILNTYPLATDGARVYVPLKDKGLAVVNATTGTIERTLATTFPSAKLVQANGVVVSAGWESSTNCTMWDEPPTNRMDSWRIWGIRTPGTDKGVVEAFDPITGSRLWQENLPAQNILATGDFVVGVGQGAPPVTSQIVFARAARSGKELWRRTFTADTNGGDLILVGVDPERVYLGRHTPGTQTQAVRCRALLALSTSNGRTLWESPTAGSPVILVVKQEVLYGGERLDAKTGAILGKNGIGVYQTMCTPPFLLGQMGGTGRAVTWHMISQSNGPTPQNVSLNGIRTSCIDGLAVADQHIYIAQNLCRCAPGDAPGFLALGSQAQPKEADYHISRPVEHGAVSAPAVAPALTPEDWPTFRHDNERTSASSGRAPLSLHPLWTTNLARPLKHPSREAALEGCLPLISAPVAVGETVWVSACEAGEVIAINLNNGATRWRTALGARLDSPPAIDGGLCLVGSRDGRATALTAATGELVWSARIAPADRSIFSFGQVESAWPVTGSPLIRDGVAWCLAGRSTEIDGGAALVTLDARTGNTRWATTFSNTIFQNGRRTDILSTRDQGVGFQTFTFSPADGSWLNPSTKPGGYSLACLNGWLDTAWTRVGRRRGGNYPVGPALFDTLAWENDACFGVWASPPFNRLIAFSKAKALAISKATELTEDWKTQFGPNFQTEAMALTPNAVVLAGRIRTDDPAKMHGFLAMFQRGNGAPIAQIETTAAPAPHGLCVAHGRILLAMEDGMLAAFGDSTGH